MRRSIAGIATTMALVVPALAGIEAPAMAQIVTRFYPVRAVVPSDQAFTAVLEVDDQGRYAVYNDGATDALVDMASGATTVLEPNARFRVSGKWTVDLLAGNQFRRTDIVTGEAQTYTVPFSSSYRIGGVSDYSDDGRVVGVAGLLPNDLARWFLFDTSTGLLLTPEPGVPTSEIFSVLIDVARDGSAIVTADSCCAGANYSRVRRLDVVTGETVVVEMPTEHDPFAANWFTSDDLEWVWFRSSAAVVAGVPAGASRWYRRHVPSGITHVVPVDATRVRDLVPDDDGRLVFTMTTTGSDADLQAYFWRGAGELPAMLTVDDNGAPADQPVRPGFLWWSEDGARVTVLSFATNLVPGLPAAPAGRLYQFTIPSPPAANPASIVLPSSTMCVPAVGAAPGDVVAVNVTPVLALQPGFGTVHPGGSNAGGTSNVNFTRASVDPNVAIVDVGPDGTVCFTNSEHGAIHVLIDELVVGDGAAFDPPTDRGAERIVDTRAGVAGSRLAPGERRCFPVVGAAPGDTVVVNALAIGASGPGFGTFHSSGDPAGAISNINYATGSFDPNLSFVVVGADGRVCFSNGPTASTDVIADQLVVGDASVFRAPTRDGAVRIMDTRLGLGGPVVAPSERRCVAAVGALPGEYVMLNATPVEATAFGFGTLHSSADPAGSTSNVNFGPGSVDPNIALTRVGPDGNVCFTNSRHASVHVILDELVVGAASAFRPASDRGAVRLVDTRIGR